jgi:glycosyltransferase involved in cell wall biosynthesis
MSTTNHQINKISIVTPFYNEERAIPDFYLAMQDLKKSLPNYALEIICVDDGSSDGTLKQLITLSQQDNDYRVIEFTRNFGKEPALSAGIDAATGDAVIPIDADLQDPPDLIPQMIAEWKKGAEVVLAKRVDRSSDSFSKRTSASFFYKTHNMLSSLKIPENVGDFRLMDRTVIDALKQLPERQRFMKGLFAWVGFKAVTIEYVRKPRDTGKTKFSGWQLWNFALEGITSFSLIPLKIWTYLGGFGALFAFFYASFIVIRTLIFGIDIPGYASLLVVILFFGSIQLISLGVLGEYIGRIYFETKNRPLYLIRRTYSKSN